METRFGVELHRDKYSLMIREAKKHLLFGQDQTALQICLYYDDVEMCNPLGIKKTVHQLGMWLTFCLWHLQETSYDNPHCWGRFSEDVQHMRCYCIHWDPVRTVAVCIGTIFLTSGFFYYNIGNVHPRHRSKLSSIHLVAITKRSHIKKVQHVYHTTTGGG
jgi:hypothetical protein